MLGLNVDVLFNFPYLKKVQWLSGLALLPHSKKVLALPISKKAGRPKRVRYPAGIGPVSVEFVCFSPCLHSPSGYSCFLPQSKDLQVNWGL